MTILISKPDKNKTRQRRHLRVRNKISGTAECPRLNVYRSNKNIYAQVIDDVEGVTLASASTLDKEVSGSSKTEQANAVGSLVAKRAADKKIKNVVFDRGGYLYHGRVKALAEGARENGLEF
ncbi:50S ribosomal protein L18 [Apilactobacillus ozensis DSM 23829 = JCM 17196]|uniref:Large ribosomal subunit protein uL18 n=1 Tax=Apilactobacillus ozensis DSM 23829 = JCM 17196 TaxID=1423781 RepID=A0A0R2AZT1_9LACO|nr:50S ribosomal protein L18 [Apilactobacillus ozensis]KRM68284.1 50S ribosomal protein L18 [Apilactobacillus ozensis DSM 23829 = JCM 17196]